MAKILIIGGSGFLGTKLRKILSKKNKVISTYLNNKKESLYYLDITDKKAVDEFFKEHNPEIVILTAAMSLVYKCEKKKELSEKINHMGTKHIVDVCRKTGAKLVYISTSHVFDGKKESYKENDPVNPLNFYGKTKVEAEKEVITLKNSIIIRFDIIYGYNEPNENNGFFSEIIKGEKLEVNKDRKIHPLLVDDAANSIQILLEKGLSGTYHLGGENITTIYELARALEKIVRKKSCLVPVSKKQSEVKRPEKISLDTSKAKKLGINFHSLSEGISIMEQQFNTLNKDN